MDEQFLTGHPGIDQQHRILFGIIEHLHSPEPRDFADDVQTALDLIKYVIQHFAFEENLMFRSRYPNAGGHLENHRQITATVTSYKDRILRGEDPHVELADFVDTWIRHHIGEEDRRLAAHLIALEAAGGPA